MKVTRTENQGSDSSSHQFLAFELGSETYGVPLLEVQEIRTYSPATSIPNAPDYVLGVINLRGSIIAVIDLRTRLGMPPMNEEDQSIVVVVNFDGKTFGLRGDSVSDVVEIADDQVQPPPTITIDETKRFLSGLAQLQDRVIILLDTTMVIDIDAVSQMVA